MRSVAPGCTPVGIFKSTVPSTVRTFTVVPRIAFVYGMVTVVLMFMLSKRFKSGSSRTAMKTYKSPGGPPFLPAFPSDLTRKREPESTPAGTRNDMRLLFRTLPSPPHFGHGVEVCPLPPQAWHVVTC